MPEIPEPIEDVDYFRIKRLRYELHVEGTTFIIADEKCDDFEVDAARSNLSTPTVVSTTMVSSEERRIDDPTKPFDRKAWMVAKRIELGEYVRPHEKTRPPSETTLADFPPKRSILAWISARISAWCRRWRRALREAV
jgi:hypothetical protein